MKRKNTLGFILFLNSTVKFVPLRGGNFLKTGFQMWVTNPILKTFASVFIN